MMIFQILVKIDDFFKFRQKMMIFQNLAKMMIFQIWAKMMIFEKTYWGWPLVNSYNHATSDGIMKQC